MQKASVFSNQAYRRASIKELPCQPYAFAIWEAHLQDMQDARAKTSQVYMSCAAHLLESWVIKFRPFLTSVSCIEGG